MVIFAMKKVVPVNNARYSLNPVLSTLIIAFLSVMVLSVGGCVTAGKNFDISRAAAIQKGVTTKNEILTMFGKPYSKSQSSVGETWMYQYMEMRPHLSDVFALVGIYHANQSLQMMFITFQGDIVQDYNITEQGK
ncbi:MAG: hypothetical protein Q8O71_03920 [bacterium]|nr:hypothetical protein [bacterium]